MKIRHGRNPPVFKFEQFVCSGLMSTTPMLMRATVLDVKPDRELQCSWCGQVRRADVFFSCAKVKRLHSAGESGSESRLQSRLVMGCPCPPAQPAGTWATTSGLVQLNASCASDSVTILP